MKSRHQSLRHLLLLVAFLVCGRSGPAQPPPYGPGYNGVMRQPPRAQYPQRMVQQDPEAVQADPQRRTAPDSALQEHQAEHLYRTGRAYIERGYYSEGLEALNQSLALRPNYARALTFKGIALRALREPRLALEQFNAALAVAPEDGVAHGERGLVYIILGEPEKAEEDLRISARLRPDLVPWFTQQGRWMAANRQGGIRNDELPPESHPATAMHTPSTIAGAEAPPGTAETEDAEGIAEARASWWKSHLAGAWSLVQPAMFVVLGFLGLLLVLRVLYGLTRRLLRRAARPWQSQLRLRPPPPRTPIHSPQTADAPHRQPHGNPPTYAPVPDPAISRRRLFRRRHRGLLVTAGLGFAVMLLFAVPVLVQAFRLDADKLVAPRMRPSVLDFRGNVYTQLGTPDTPIEYSDLPAHLVDALRAREDSRFFEHQGVDWYGLLRATGANLRHMRIKQGASTLTMQLVEKVYALEQKGLLNRVRSKLVEWTMAHRGEAALATRLGSRRAAKEAIMVAYLNRVEFGGGTVGVGAASQYYFEKPVSELTLGESCMLVALLRAPTANSPYRNPENSRLARDKIVAQMLRRGYISEHQAKQARFYVVDNPRKPASKHNGYLVAAITREINALKAEGKLPGDVWDHEDLTIQSTMDLWAQDILDSEIRSVVSGFRGDTEADPLGGAGMIVDNATGQIRALVSGQDYSKSQYDLALVSRRQVASIAKPFVYGAYLEQGGDISEVVSNAELSSGEIRALNNWNPKNSTGLKAGTHPLSSGLAFSDNYITARVALKAGLRRVYDTLYSAGLVSDKTTTGSTWLLGTFESSLEDVVSAYTTFPRGGTRVAPYLVQSVVIEGKEVYRAEPQTTGLFSRRTATQLHQALREAMTEGTGRNAVRTAGLGAAVAGKTGTSQNAADVWWVGYVNEVTLGVRFGRDSNASLGDAAAGGTLAAPAAARVLKKLSERAENTSRP